MIKIGKNKQATTLGERLLDCHERIRDFLTLATKLAATPNAPPAERAEAAASIHRYFQEALPRHVADEEQSIKPRLKGRDPTLDAALDRMTTEHQQHDPVVARLLALCKTIESGAPTDLAPTAAELDQLLRSHLEEEEQTWIPALERLLSAEERAEIIEEMKQRRERRE